MVSTTDESARLPNEEHHEGWAESSQYSRPDWARLEKFVEMAKVL